MGLMVALVAAAAAALRMGVAVRAIRALDRRGGFASRCGERTYARSAGVFAGLHRRAATDAVAWVPHGGTLVDIGAGPGSVLSLVATRRPDMVCLGVEPSPAMRAIAAAAGIEELPGSAEALPLATGSVDLALSTLSAHHWHDAVAAFREIDRVLAPGGEARIYDVRFAGFTRSEARSIAIGAGIDPGRVRRTVLADRLLGVRPYALITITRET